MNFEEELQHSIERGDIDDSGKYGPESDAYRMIFRALWEKPEQLPPQNFADNVVERINERAAKKSLPSRIDYLWLAAGIMTLLLTAIFTTTSINFQLDLGVLNHVLAYKGLIGFCLIFLVVLNYIDRRLIRPTRRPIA